MREVGVRDGVRGGGGGETGEGEGEGERGRLACKWLTVICCDISVYRHHSIVTSTAHAQPPPFSSFTHSIRLVHSSSPSPPPPLPSPTSHDILPKAQMREKE